MTGVIGYAGFAVAIFALISVIISVALDYWTYFSETGRTVYTGLWNGCSEIEGIKLCGSLTELRQDVTTELKLVRAMVLLALVLDVGAIACGALKLFMMKENKTLGYAAAGLVATAGLLLIVGFAVYIVKVFNPAKDLNPKTTLHAGFAFCIIAWLASWTAAGLFGVATMQDRD